MLLYPQEPERMRNCEGERHMEKKQDSMFRTTRCTPAHRKRSRWKVAVAVILWGVIGSGGMAMVVYGESSSLVCHEACQQCRALAPRRDLESAEVGGAGL